MGWQHLPLHRLRGVRAIRPAYEVADIVEHASSRLSRFLDVDAFIHGMELDARQHRRLTYFRRLFAAFWLTMLLPGNRGFERNPAGSTEDQARQVLALLDCA